MSGCTGHGEGRWHDERTRPFTQRTRGPPLFRAGEVARQLTLPGQAATADGPLDMTMMYVMHHAFRRDLRALTRSVTVTPLGDRVAWRELHRRWRLFAYVLHHHHTGEDEGLLASCWP